MDDHASKLKGLAWLAAGCLLGIVCAVGLTPIAHAIPWSWEKKLGQTLDWGTERECRANLQTDALLRQLVKRLYPVEPEDKKFSIEVEVVRDNAINAFATLGGKIFVNSGLLKQAESPEELAGVLAHEIGHVHHRHIMRGALAHLFTSQGLHMIFGDHSSTGKWANDIMTMDFSRAQEAEADQDGLQRLHDAHIDNQGFKHFFERMEKEENAPAFLSDHPSNHSRMEMVGKFSNNETIPIMPHEDWQKLKGYCEN